MHLYFSTVPKETLLCQIFIDVDDFTNALDAYERKHRLPAGSARRGPKRSMVISEVMTILIFYHYSGLVLWAEGPLIGQQFGATRPRRDTLLV
jgi:hypothetical protein